MLGSSLLFSTIKLVGVLFKPESPRFLMHKGRVLESFQVWKRIRGLELQENKEEFFIMRHAVQEESEQKRDLKSSAWVDFFTLPHARRLLVYATIIGLPWSIHRHQRHHVLYGDSDEPGWL
jgi:Sugar (and other) transporter